VTDQPDHIRYAAQQFAQPGALTDEQLLPWLVAEEHRGRQQQRGHTTLHQPWPGCPTCQTAVTEVIGRDRTPVTDPNGHVTLAFGPCGHHFYVSYAAILRLQDQAHALVDRQENRAADEPPDVAPLRDQIATALVGRLKTAPPAPTYPGTIGHYGAPTAFDLADSVLDAIRPYLSTPIERDATAPAPWTPGQVAGLERLANAEGFEAYNPPQYELGGAPVDLSRMAEGAPAPVLAQPVDTDPAAAALEDIACHLYLVFCEQLPSCGCGDPEAGYQLIHQLLALDQLHQDDNWRKAEELCGSPGAHQLVLSALNDADLLEHGTSISNSWRTGRGDWVMWAVEQLGGIDALDARLSDAGYPHEYDPKTKRLRECTDACWTIPATPDATPAAPIEEPTR
jgi:hypothetical protein